MLGEIDPKTFAVEKDGAVNLHIDGKPARWVKESDLLTVKGASESKAKEWETKEATFNTQIADLTKKQDESHQTLLQERAAKEAVEVQAKEAAALKTKAVELEKDIATHKEGRGKLENELAERIKSGLTFNGAQPDVLKDKTLDQLRNLEEAAKLLGRTTKQAKYDGGGSGPPAQTEAPLDRARRIIEESEKRRGIVRVSNTAVAK